MAVDWNKLVKDLKVGKELANKAAEGEDGGSANLDYVYIRLPRQREDKVKKEVAKSGLRTYKTQIFFGTPVFAISGLNSGQGNSNYRAVQALYKHLEENGWDVGINYIMD